jgi:hypothetical protein
MSISDQTTKEIDDEIAYTSMARMLDLGDVLEPIENAFYNRSFS